MGLLTDDYYKKLQEESAARSDAGPITSVENKIIAPIEAAQDIGVQNIEANAPTQPTDVTSPEYQAETERISGRGTTGSQFLRSVGEVFGMKFPGDAAGSAAWDNLPTASKLGYIAKEIPLAAAKIVVRAPREIVKAPIRLGYSIYKPWADLASGKQDSFNRGTNVKQELKIPWLGSVSTYWKSYDEARASGQGPLAASISTGTLALGDATITASLAESINKAFQPRSSVNGRVISNTQPIKEAITRDKAGVRVVSQVADSPNEYYSLPKTVAQKYGGSTNDTFLKITPANVVGDSNAVEISVVQTRGGFFKSAIDKVKGNKSNVYEGDFGPETKFENQIVNLKKPAPTSTAQPAMAIPEIEGSKISIKKLQGGDSSILDSIPSAPLKGFENARITNDQLSNLDKISQVNKIDPELAKTIIRNVSGKELMGEMTQSDYVKSAQVLAAFNKGSRVTTFTKEPFVNPVSQNLSPTRRFYRHVEEQTNIPVYSKGYVPIEDAAWLSKQFVDLHDNRLTDIFKKTNDYSTPKFAEERRLVKAYIEGNTDAILKNPKLDEVVKQDLIKIVTELEQFYNEIGPALGIDPKYFLKNYQPHIQNIGGVYQLYKEGEPIPKALDYFAEHKRNGALTTQIDDALSLAQITTRAGAKKLFFNPALEEVYGVINDLPPTLQSSLKNFVQEKLGYAGRTEQFLNDLVPKINEKLGMNLPLDSARVATQLLMDTTYSAALGLRPDAVVRNLLQAPLLVYPRLGSRFFTEGFLKSLTKEGRAELHSKGILVELGVPYGEELAKESTLTGTVGSTYRKISQGTLKPYAGTDVITRGVAYFQGKAIFDDALGKYLSGKANWAETEKNLDLQAFSPIDRNIIREKLVAGDNTGAFDHYIRDIIDETNFPYRKGAPGQAFYGLGGKIGGQFMQWPIEYAHTLGSWVKTGQWDKLIRFYAAATATKRTVEDTLGMNIKKWIGLNPLDLSIPPFAKIVGEIGQLMSAHIKQNSEEIQQHQDEIVKQVKSLSFPGGVQAQRVNNFLHSISLSKKDKLPAGQYGIYDRKGRLVDTTDFNNLFWGTLWGFPTSEKVGNQDLQQEMRNATFNYNQAKQNVLELYRQEKFDEANKIIQEHSISLTSGDFDKYYIPLNQRTFQYLPAALKAQFAPKVYNNK